MSKALGSTSSSRAGELGGSLKGGHGSSLFHPAPGPCGRDAFIVLPPPVKSEEEHPLRGPEDILEEKSYHHFGHLRSNLSPGSKLGLWVPYSAEWSPATSPLHGLLNCLKDIPVPRPRPPQILSAKRGAMGEKERRRGGRRGCFGPPSEACPPQGSEASLGEKPAQQSFLAQGYANGPHEREPAGRKGEMVAGQEDLGIMKEHPPSAHIQPASPAVNLSVSSSPDCLPWWTPEPARWRRKEDELGQAQSPLQSLGKGFKETPLGSLTQASSPATSSSPDGFQRWPSRPMQRARREEGLGQSSTPLQGLEKCLKDIQNQRWSPAVTSSMHSSPDRLRQWTPEPVPWARREGGGSPVRVPPLQGLENCLKEIAPRREFLAASGPSGRSICAPKRPGTEEAHSPRPWPAENLPPPCASSSEEAAENSPLHRLMNCLKEIPIQRPSYLNPPSAFSSSPSSSSSSSSSSSCSETERDQQSPGSSTWWDGSQGRPQLPGSERDALVGRKVTMEPKRKRPSTQLPAEEDKRLSSTQEANFANGGDEASSASLLGHPQNNAKDTADVKQMFPSTHPLRSSRARQNVMSRSSEAREDGPPSTLLVHKIFTRERQKSPRGTALVQTPTCFSPLSHNSQDGTPEGDTDWSLGEEQIQPQPGDKEAGTRSSPLQGLLRCLKEITYPTAPSPCPSSARKRPRESRYTQEEEEEEEEEAAHCKKKSWQSALPSSSPISDVETRGTQSNGHSRSLNTRTSAHKQSEPPRWSPSVSFRMGAQRTSATAGDKGSPPAPEAGPEAKKRPHEVAHLCHCAHGAEPGFAQPFLSKQLGRLAADVNGLCRDLSSLQSHVWRLEQEARGWALELAALHLENRHLAKYARRLESRCQVLETRSRRLNLRLSGLPEGVEGGDPVAFLRRTLPEVLGWSSGGPVLEIESARRVGGRDLTAKPRPVVFRLLRSADKAAVLEAARTRPLRFAEAQLAILPDLGTPRRRPPLGPFRRSRWVVDLLLGGQPHTPWGLGRSPAWWEPPVPCMPLAAKAAPGTLGSHAQHNP